VSLPGGPGFGSRARRDEPKSSNLARQQRNSRHYVWVGVSMTVGEPAEIEARLAASSELLWKR